LETEKNLKGMHGWLILIGIGLVVSPIKLAMEVVPLFYNIFTDGSFEYLTTPGTDSYHPLWKPLLIFEAIYNLTIILASIFVSYLFFTKHYRFPKAYIILAILPIILIPLDAWLGSFVVKDEPMFDTSTLKEFVTSIFSAMIWIPYMIVSKRVKATFVEGKSAPASAPTPTVRHEPSVEQTE
jgi:hypothetical protein